MDDRDPPVGAGETVESLARFPEENPNPILRIANDSRLIYANRLSAELLRHWDMRVGDTVPTRVSEAIGLAVAESRTIELEEQTPGKVFSLLVTPIPGQSYSNIYGRDVSHLKEVEQRTRDLARFPDENPNPVMRISRGGVVLYTNQPGRVILDHWGTAVGSAVTGEIRVKMDLACSSGTTISSLTPS